MRHGVRLLLLCCAGLFDFQLCASAQAPAPASTNASPLELRAQLSHSGYTSATRLFWKIDYNSSAAQRQDRPALNLALVLDSSGSMAADQKIKYTIDAARAVIENLTERDTISLISFNDRVTVLSPAERAVNKAFLFHRLEEIAPRGYTDLSAGLLEGIAQIKSKKAEGQMRQVLLLTDGIANRGLTTDEAFRRLAGKAHAEGIGISTLGCGTEFNEKHLTALADAGGGRYTYISAPDQIPAAFEQELHGLLEASAQNVRLNLSVTGASMVKVNGQLLERPAPERKFEIGNLRAGERGLILVELKPADGSESVEATARFTFDDPESAQRLTSEIQRTVRAIKPELIKEEPSVVLYAELFDALNLAEEAAKGMDLERYRKAEVVFPAIYKKAHDFAVANNDQELLNQTFLLKHFSEEFAAARKHGLLHEHREARVRFAKEADYRRYLLLHHEKTPLSHPPERHD